MQKDTADFPNQVPLFNETKELSICSLQLRSEF